MFYTLVQFGATTIIRFTQCERNDARKTKVYTK